MMRRMEKQIEEHLLNHVRRLGGVAYKFTSPATRGVADRVVCLPDGSTWFVEIKAPGGRLSPLQHHFRNNMLRLKQRYACLWSKEDVNNWVMERERETA